MAQIPYRANLNSGHFPFLSAYHGQTVIIPGRDQAFKNQVVVGQESEDKDIGFPQLYYCHNAMPTVQGVKSIGFNTTLAGVPGSVAFDDIYSLRDPDENKFLFSPAQGYNYVFDGDSGEWINASITVNVQPPQVFNPVSVAYVNGQSYVFYPNDNLYSYDPTTKKFVVETMVGVTAANLKGVTASNGFLIAWDDFSVYRSQATLPLDFTPDFSLGSGASIPEAVAGKIVSCLPINGGFIIYTTRNAVSATWSQNIRFPFNYNEVAGSGGIQTPRHVAWNHNIGVHYAWTQSGLQKVDKVKAVAVFSEVTDFLTAKVFEDYNTTTDEFEVTKLTSTLSLRVAASSERFLAISYGVLSSLYTHALIYDLVLKRWGKIKIDHAAIFELYLPNRIGPVTYDDLAAYSYDDLAATSYIGLDEILNTFEKPKENVAVLGRDGTVYIIDFDDVHVGDAGVAVFGKYQFVRERFVAIEQVEVENIDQTYTNFSLKILTSLDGKNIAKQTTPYLHINLGAYRRYMCNVDGKNHALAFKGTFAMASLEFMFRVTSRR